jgi:hypothetical protein
MRRFIRRPSPATALAMLALLIALGGTSIAAVEATLPANSVGTVQLKNAAVTGAKVRLHTLLRAHFAAGQVPTGPRGAVGPSGPAGPAGAAGPAGPAGGGAKWAVVRADGGIAAQSGGITLTAKPTAGQYILDFGSAVTGKLILTSSAHAGGDLAFRGTVSAGPCNSSAEGSTCPAGNDTSHVRIFTNNAGNTANADHAFYIAVFG